MLISWRRLWGWLKRILLFLLLSFLVYQIITFLSPYLHPSESNEPGDGAVKVWIPSETFYTTLWHDLRERLLLFYWLGE